MKILLQVFAKQESLSEIATMMAAALPPTLYVACIALGITSKPISGASITNPSEQCFEKAP